MNYFYLSQSLPTINQTESYLIIILVLLILYIVYHKIHCKHNENFMDME